MTVATSTPDPEIRLDRQPLPDPETRPHMSILEAGAYLGLGRSGSYTAANLGYIPTIHISPRRRVVPTAALRKMLLLDDTTE